MSEFMNCQNRYIDIRKKYMNNRENRLLLESLVASREAYLIFVVGVK